MRLAYKSAWNMDDDGSTAHIVNNNKIYILNRKTVDFKV